MDFAEIAELMDLMSKEEREKKTRIDFEAIDLKIEKSKSMLEESRILTEEDMSKMIGY